MKLCVFQGTFNPIHKAHLKMAHYALDNYNFDKILFIPAYIPPHKESDTKLAKHRLEMVKLAIQDTDRFEVSDIEYKSERPSYTYLTVSELYKNFDIEGKIHFIIGIDAINKIDSWYEAEKLKKILKFVVFPRGNKNINVKECDYVITDMEFCDISSTDIRKKIKNNNKINNLVTDNVER